MPSVGFLNLTWADTIGDRLAQNGMHSTVRRHQKPRHAAELASELGIQAIRAARPKQGFGALVPKAPGTIDFASVGTLQVAVASPACPVSETKSSEATTCKRYARRQRSTRR